MLLKTLKGDYHLALQQCLVLGHILKAKKIFAFKNGFDQCMLYACVDTTSDTVHTYIKLVPVSKNKNHYFHRPKKVPRFGSPACQFAKDLPVLKGKFPYFRDSWRPG